MQWCSILMSRHALSLVRANISQKTNLFRCSQGYLVNVGEKLAMAKKWQGEGWGGGSFQATWKPPAYMPGAKSSWALIICHCYTNSVLQVSETPSLYSYPTYDIDESYQLPPRQYIQYCTVVRVDIILLPASYIITTTGTCRLSHHTCSAIATVCWLTHPYKCCME